MENENNYIVIPLLCLFASLCCLLFATDTTGADAIIPSSLLFVLSIVDLHREVKKDATIANDYNNYGYRNPYYSEKGYRYNSGSTTTHTHKKEVVTELEYKKIVGQLDKNKNIKQIKNDNNNGK